MKNKIIDVKVDNKIEEIEKPTKKDQIKYWSKQEIKEKMEKIEKAKYKVMFEFLFRTGVRLGELLSIKKKDIDLKNYLITIKWLKNRKYKYRNIPMQPILREILIVYTSVLNKEDLLFPYSHRQVQRLTKKYFNGNPHMFRHSFAVLWLQSGESITVLSKMLGHKNIQTTMRYAQIVPQEVGKSLMKINFEND